MGVTSVGFCDGGAGDLYAVSYPRLVRLLTLAAGSRTEAEDVVQEAFVRLVPRWSKISRYDDPEAWVRKVAFRLLSNRSRRARTAVSALSRSHCAAAAAPAVSPSPDPVDVNRALTTLPIQQRQVIVLHYLLDLSVEQVATELGVPPGTVKSRLSRARTALAPLLSEEINHA
jgi:RNA polymerase sigma-70 factor, ECF subfamily